MADAMKIPGFVAAYLRPLFLEGRGPFRWTCTSGELSDLARLDDLVMELFGDDDIPSRWITLAREHVPIEGLPRASATSASASASASGWRSTS